MGASWQHPHVMLRSPTRYADCTIPMGRTRKALWLYPIITLHPVALRRWAISSKSGLFSPPGEEAISFSSRKNPGHLVGILGFGSGLCRGSWNWGAGKSTTLPMPDKCPGSLNSCPTKLWVMQVADSRKYASLASVRRSASCWLGSQAMRLPRS